ncbi:hypothetical protein M5K25_025048 [Dendrobium thyrsiflorum]|uniref:Uncharacterized protein n=1 Tax=Dendrobium thyrsiflorum TaxID=117978 RepID=A0ABD0U861_DENTH
MGGGYYWVTQAYEAIELAPRKTLLRLRFSKPPRFPTQTVMRPSGIAGLVTRRSRGEIGVELWICSGRRYESGSWKWCYTRTWDRSGGGGKIELERRNGREFQRGSIELRKCRNLIRNTEKRFRGPQKRPNRTVWAENLGPDLLGRPNQPADRPPGGGGGRAVLGDVNLCERGRENPSMMQDLSEVICQSSTR